MHEAGELQPYGNSMTGFKKHLLLIDKCMGFCLHVYLLTTSVQ